MKAAILNAFFGMLRISEYSTKTDAAHDFTPGIQATRGDVEIFPNILQPEGYRLTVPKSKTDQFRAGHTLTIYATGHPTLCPARAMAALFRLDQQPPTAQLFRFDGKSASRTTFVRIFDRLLVQCNIPTSNIKTHSLRSGGATAYLQTGTDPYIVAKMGRWASFCFTIYTWASTDHLKSAAQRLAYGSRKSAPVNLEPMRLGNYDH